MKLNLSENAKKELKRLPTEVRRSFSKKMGYLLEDFRHKSLNVKKYGGLENIWQARVNKDYRFYFIIQDNYYIITSVTKHPK